MVLIYNLLFEGLNREHETLSLGLLSLIHLSVYYRHFSQYLQVLKSEFNETEEEMLHGWQAFSQEMVDIPKIRTAFVEERPQRRPGEPSDTTTVYSPAKCTAFGGGSGEPCNTATLCVFGRTYGTVQCSLHMWHPHLTTS